MDNREVLVKLQYNTKYGVQLNSSRVIKNYNLYKYLVLKHVSEQVYIDYANEDCELVNLKGVLDESLVIYDKVQIESFNNIKTLLNKDLNVQYDLFSLIDNVYNDTLGHIVDRDLSFDKYSYFYKQLLDISKSLMIKYIGTEDYPKDVNQLYLKELGEERYNLLLEWLNDPIVNDSNINCVINCVQNLTNKNNTLCKIKDYEIPLHKAAHERTNIDVESLFTVKEKVIITKNIYGFYTFKDLIFNIQNSLVIGKFNSKNNRIDLLSSNDIKMCVIYNLKYDESKVNKNELKGEKVEKVEKKILIQDENINDNVHQQYEQQKTNDNKSLMMTFFNNLKEQSLKESLNKNLENNKEEDTPVLSNIIDRHQIINSTLNEPSELNESSELNEPNELNEPSELNELNELNELLNPYSSTIIPIINEKVSRGRKKATTVIVGTTSLKQKAPTVRKSTGKL